MKIISKHELGDIMINLGWWHIWILLDSTRFQFQIFNQRGEYMKYGIFLMFPRVAAILYLLNYIFGFRRYVSGTRGLRKTVAQACSQAWATMSRWQSSGLRNFGVFHTVGLADYPDDHSLGYHSCLGKFLAIRGIDKNTGKQVVVAFDKYEFYARCTNVMAHFNVPYSNYAKLSDTFSYQMQTARAQDRGDNGLCTCDNRYGYATQCVLGIRVGTRLKDIDVQDNFISKYGIGKPFITSIVMPYKIIETRGKRIQYRNECRNGGAI